MINFQSVMESPECVRRVMPPMITIEATIMAPVTNQAIIHFLSLSIWPANVLTVDQDFGSELHKKARLALSETGFLSFLCAFSIGSRIQWYVLLL